MFYSLTPSASGNVIVFSETFQPGDIVQFVSPLSNLSNTEVIQMEAGSGQLYPVMYNGSQTLPVYLLTLSESYTVVFTGTYFEVTSELTTSSSGTINTQPFVVNNFINPGSTGLLATQIAQLNELISLSSAVNAGILNSVYVVASTSAGGDITADANQLTGGYLADGATQTADFTITTDTASNILAALPNSAVGTTFKWRFLNNDQSATGFSGTLAGGSGVTVGTILPNPAVSQGNWEDYIFTFTAVGATPTLTVEAVGGSSLGLL